MVYNFAGDLKCEVKGTDALFKTVPPECVEKMKFHLRSHARGSESTPAGKVFSNYPGGEEAVFNRWFDVLRTSSMVTPELLAYETQKKSKVGAQGGYPPLAARMDELNGYYTLSQPLSLDPGEYDTLVESTRTVLFGNTSGLAPMDYTLVVERLRRNGNLSTNSGFPYFGKRSFYLSESIRDARNGMWAQYPCIIGSRGQRNSSRFIFMAPFSTNLVEQSFLFPLMDTIRELGAEGLQAWYGNDAVVDSYTDSGYLSCESFLSTDFTAMDKYTGEEQIEFVLDVVRPCVGEKYTKLLEKSLRHLNMCDLLIGEDFLIAGRRHGLFSGLGWTNFSECVLNTGIQVMTQKILGVATIRQLLGDDGTMGWLQDLERELATSFEKCASAFGYVANAEKQLVSNLNLTFLQRFYDKRILFTSDNGRVVVAGSYPGVLGLNSLIHPERFHTPWSDRMESLRAICICENLYQHPCFDQFVELVLSGDRLKLGILSPGFLDGLGLEKAYSASKSLTGFMPAYTGAHGGLGIRDWRTIRKLVAVRHRYIR
jgi:hypothetical protein